MNATEQPEGELRKRKYNPENWDKTARKRARNSKEAKVTQLKYSHMDAETATCTVAKITQEDLDGEYSDKTKTETAVLVNN